MADNNSWETIFSKYEILKHDFTKSPFPLSAEQIKIACQHFTTTSAKEVRILCKQDSREDVPQIMSDNGLFLLPVRNGRYVIVKGNGYFDVPEITGKIENYTSKLPFELESAKIGNSEMQHLDNAYAISIIRSFFKDDTLVLAIRGRKYTPPFSFYVGKQEITTGGVQTEVDAGYEGKKTLVLIEAKNSTTSNTIIRQLFYPFKQWSYHIPSKKIYLLFFEKRNDIYMLWLYQFTDPQNYNSINLVKSKRYRLID